MPLRRAPASAADCAAAREIWRRLKTKLVFSANEKDEGKTTTKAARTPISENFSN
jgi:hypothetical protein